MANIQLCSVWLQNVSRGWPMQAVARLDICTMRIGLNIIVLLSGGFRVGGPEARLKKGPSDDVIILSQPWWELLIKPKIRPPKNLFLRVRHDWHSRERKRKRVFMIHNFENTERWEDTVGNTKVRPHQVGISRTSLFSRPISLHSPWINYKV